MPGTEANGIREAAASLRFGGRVLERHLRPNCALHCVPFRHEKEELSSAKGLLPYLTDGPRDVLVNRIGDLCPLHSTSELHGEHAGVMPQPPVVGLVPGQAGAVDPGLLPCPNANHLQQTSQQQSGRLTPKAASGLPSGQRWAIPATLTD